MRKQSLIHVHTLLQEIRQNFDRRPGCRIPDDAFDDYRAHGVAPSHIHLGKDAHEEAIDRLLDGITRVIAENQKQVA
jgi:hypothetical protein